ncbi:hypothetical protein A3C67_00360 [Candidatus Nomurabacteria bacterium RIFCSPHIGHO2_02_FULL_42_19]|uniref:Plasmid stabilization protein n=1 Tax=Candidatus Nomurabacteria bacterium RIFCSPHIGHO2_02_FULL_42_19 TaxID=1801756 RepID=A0A1F6W3G4_9BACT|nr:MAG: hypothetical protein A3C67_00360 [Candidatus Nomurabacteria bacterium RIFCSPHIGHO2_02_FULL_42_19]
MKIAYTQSFIKQYNNLPNELQEEVLEKTELFKDRKNHKMLKVHKLHGRFASRYSFSIDYRYRIVFGYLKKDEVVFMTVGDHDVYK